MPCNTCNATSKPDGSDLAKCGKCKKTTYCSRACQRKDYAEHKTGCYTPEERQLRKDVKSEATSFSLACEVCSKSAITTGTKLDRCSLCRAVFYCGKECQTKDWPAHMKVCPGALNRPTGQVHGNLRLTPLQE